MSDLSITAGNVKKISGGVSGGKVGQTVAAGDIVGLPAGSGAALVKLTNQNLLGQPRMALAAASTGQFVNVAYPSTSNGSLASVIDLGVSTTNNTMYFLSENAGKICPYADLQSGDKIVLLGIGLGSNRLLFYPVDTGLIR